MARFILLSVGLFFFLFSFTCLKEKEKRATVRSFFFFLVNALFFGLSFLLPISFQKIFSSAIVILFFFFLILSVIPFEKKCSIRIIYPIQKVDERDVIFSRTDLIPGTETYKEYYERHPEFKEIDDKIRKSPPLLQPGSTLYHALTSELAQSEFDFLEAQLKLVNGQVNSDKIYLEAEEATHWIKKLTSYLGAKLVGIAQPDKAFYYSHVGRGPEPYGQKIELNHSFAIAFAVEMSFNQISQAPSPPVVVETGKQYVEAARISIILANYIRSLGYQARAHIAGSNYQAILPAIAYQAGLGELGRLGILITPQYGPRVRLGLVTTNLPLIPDKPITFGVQNFCEKCLKCAINCPSQAIDNGVKKNVRGVEKWPLKVEKCYQFWRKIGTDCAVCIYLCPYSKPRNLVHNSIRTVIKYSPLLRRISVEADNLFYGKNLLLIKLKK
ncbi:MAG: reductive dehalogenase [Candidatus Aminicenantia bacterium]